MNKPIMEESHDHFWFHLVLVIFLTGVMWFVRLFESVTGISLSEYGIIPHQIDGLKSILFSPFIHGSWEHLASNSLPFMVLMTVILNAYELVALRVLVSIHLLTGIMVWCFAPDNGASHIGMSGIIYGIAAFLGASGIFRRDRVSISIALFVVLAYGGMVFGFVPQPGISWQSHLFGALSGILMAYQYRNYNLPSQPNVEEEEEIDRHFFEPYVPRE